jgi:hypothetical protein|tara:strand:+ start:549 stop:848 length:300 start_codon:yes stop_codon:yes gene_type:complete
MGYDSLTSDTEALTKVKLQSVDRLKKQLQAAMRTIGNLDERLTSLESMVHAALLKQQDDIKALVVEVNSLKGNKDYEVASSKFDMDAKPFDLPNAPPVG